jgi:NAD(P)-dependent dehydrogenase (short-subunit alcohol dehydrogenase family)
MENPTSDVQNVCHVLITGATGGIGSAMVRYIVDQDPQAIIWAASRRSDAMDELISSLGEASQRVRPLIFNPVKEADLEQAIANIQKETKNLHMAIHTIGALGGQGLKAEKSLRDVTIDGMLESYTINTASFLLLAKHLHRLFRHDTPSVFAGISAKVGSIKDNELGGWYSYRMSKAALNMGVKNVALEYGRTGCKTTVVAIHPGTTETQLSKPFLAGYPKDKVATTDVTAERIYRTLSQISPSLSGHLVNWDATILPW